MPDKSEITDVLIVGAGPSGLTAACELARRGVKLRIIDKLETASDKSRALVLHARSLELLEIMGCADEFLKRGIEITGINVFDGKTRIINLSLKQIDSPYKFALGIPQNQTECILTEELRKHKIEIERGKELSELSQNEDMVECLIKTADGSEEIIRSRFLIAADGAHSTIRHGLHEPYEGGEYEELFQLADLKVDWNGSGNQSELCAFSSENGTAAFFPMPDSRWRVIIILPKDCSNDAPETEPGLMEIQERLDRISPRNLKLSDPSWLANFKIHYRKVKNYRHGRIFLAGDAAHCHSPVGGQGMNTGMQDAFNLCWKLDLAVKGQASDVLLDSYHYERNAVATQLLRSVDMMTRINLLRAPVAREIRKRFAPMLISQDFVKAKLRNFLSETGISYRSSPVVGEHKQNIIRAAVAVHTVDEPRLGDWLDFTSGPHAGDRAPDAHLQMAPSGEELRLAELFKSTKHKLLLFTGDCPMQAIFDELKELAEAVQGKYAEFVDCHLIICAETSALNLDFPGSIFFDTDYSVHERFGAGTACAYLIRPDAYVGFRSQPPDLSSIDKYFEKILIL